MTTPADVIGVARRYVGVKESPAGSNHTPFGVWSHVDRQPWCAIFASYCLYVCGYRWGDATYRWGFSYCPDIVNWGKRHGRISRTPHLGDLAVAVNGPRPHHVELVSKTGKSSFTSIGGNTGAADLSNGGEVLEHTHPVSGWVFVSPFYKAAAGPAKPAHVAPAAGGKPSPIKRNITLTTPLTAGKDVLWAQQKLHGIGLYTGVGDGVYGPHTHAAVVAFQTRIGLTPDGVLGPVTGDHLVAGK